MVDSPGTFLRKEREIRNISLEDISKFTKIKEHHLKAIEEERYELLPPALYVKGFLKIYAKYLALDSKEIVLQYQKYLESLAPPEPIESKKQAPPKRKGFRPWFFFSLIFAIIFSTVIVISFPRHYPIEEKPKAITLPLSLSHSTTQTERSAQRIYPAQQKEFSSPEKLEDNSSIPQSVRHDLLSAQNVGEPFGLSSDRKLSRVAQAEGSACLPQAGVDSEQRFSAPPYEAGLGAAERVKDIAMQQRNTLEVLEASMGTGIERDGVRQFLTGKCSDFPSNNQRGYFFTRIKTPRAGKVAHIWLWEGKEYYRMEIDVKPLSWSVYSYLTFRPYHAGNWKAEVRDGDHVLTCFNFKVISSGGNQSL
jgi:cytoskeletal protein RodZ